MFLTSRLVVFFFLPSTPYPYFLYQLSENKNIQRLFLLEKQIGIWHLSVHGFSQVCIHIYIIAQVSGSTFLSSGSIFAVVLSSWSKMVAIRMSHPNQFHSKNWVPSWFKLVTMVRPILFVCFSVKSNPSKQLRPSGKGGGQNMGSITRGKMATSQDI